MGQRWTTTSARATHNAPFAGLGTIEIPRGKALGLKIILPKAVESDWLAGGAGGPVGGYITRIPTKEEVSILIVPKLKEMGFKFIGEPKFVVDDNPMWSVRATTPEIRKMQGADCRYELYIGSGPFAGRAYSCFRQIPTLEEKIKRAPKGFFQWSAIIRPIDGKLPVERRGEVTKVVREANGALMSIVGEGGGITGRQKKPYTVEPIPVPKPKGRAIAAIIGIGLSLLTWGGRG